MDALYYSQRILTRLIKEKTQDVLLEPGAGCQSCPFKVGLTGRAGSPCVREVQGFHGVWAYGHRPPCDLLQLPIPRFPRGKEGLAVNHCANGLDQLVQRG